MDRALKQRLIGAMVLLAVGVIFLPVLFEPDTGRVVDRTTQIPAAPDIKPISIAEPVKLNAIEPAKAADEMYVLKAPITATDTAPQQHVSGSPDRNILDKKGVAKAWMIQVASFNTSDRAEELRQQLVAGGHSTFVRSLTVEGRAVTRVYVGPKIDHAKALQTKQQLDAELKLDTLVVRFHP